MKAIVQIPKGWREVKPGEFYLWGDRYLCPNGGPAWLRWDLQKFHMESWGSLRLEPKMPITIRKEVSMTVRKKAAGRKKP